MRFNGSMRRGITGTATAVAAMAALTASQAPGFAGAAHQEEAKNVATDEVVWTHVPNDDSYHTELPPLRSPAPLTPPEPGVRQTPAVVRAWAEAGIPATVFAAYRRAEATVARTDGACRLPWQLLAAIGKVESGHAAGGRVDKAGTTLSPILGPVLNGAGFANIPDTDNGAYDGDRTFDRAVGPMQFIPSTWAHWGQDGNGDGLRSPSNVYDATLAAGRYLCAGPRNLSVGADLDRAILSYNHSDTYLRTVLSWMAYYGDGAHPVPDGQGPLPTSPGAGGPTEPSAPVGGPGTIVIGPQPSGSPRPSTSPTPSGSPDPGTTPDPSTTPDPGATPDPGTTPDPSTTPDPGPTPDPTDTGTPEPTDSPTTDPTDPATTDPTDPATTDPTAPATTDPEPGCTEPAADPSAGPEPTGDPCATPTEGASE
ncbi:hypothetical protein [Streptomyces sp. NPDC060184]|uniref:lytic transglycosylase domain-containing protein n=1 Tax=Streptomyces sp. NPDC060184 TaxID=3347064 RepID=UPI0036634CA9